MQSQDAEVGDGTTSVVILAGELLEEARQFIEDGVHPQLLIAGYRKACELALERIDELAVNLADMDATYEIDVPNGNNHRKRLGFDDSCRVPPRPHASAHV